MFSFVIPVTRNVRERGAVHTSISENTGTSIIACEFNDGVIIGADSRMTTGDYIYNRAADKLIKIDDFIYCSGSGSAAEIQSIIDNAVYQLQVLKTNLGEVSVLTVAVIFRELCYRNRNSLNAEIVIAGYDNIQGAQVYVISSGGMMKRQSVSVLGSGSPYVYGYVDACFKINMSRTQVEEFVAKTLALGVARDCSSGGQIRIAVIIKGEVERYVVDT